MPSTDAGGAQTPIDPDTRLMDLTVGQLLQLLGFPRSDDTSPYDKDAKVGDMKLGELVALLGAATVAAGAAGSPYGSGFSAVPPTPGWPAIYPDPGTASGWPWNSYGY